MMMRCSICSHTRAGEINRLLAQGVPLRDIVGHVPDVSKSALHRHRAHVALLLTAAKAGADEKTGQDALGAALEKLATIEAEAVKLGRAAAKKGQYAVAGGLLVREAARLVELTARLRGLLSSGAQAAAVVQVMPDAKAAALAWLAGQIRAAQPEERAAVVAFLQRLRREEISNEVEAVRRELDSREPVHRMAGALPPPPPNGQQPGGAEPVDRVDARTQVRALAARVDWPHLRLRRGREVAGETGWRAFAESSDAAGVAEALVALEAVQPP